MDASVFVKEGETPVKKERAETALESSRHLLDRIRDEDLAKILFLAVNPNKFVGTDANTVSENLDFTKKLCASFEKALLHEIYSPLRNEVKRRIMNLLEKCEEYPTSGTSITLSSNFDSHWSNLSEAEEEILQFSEILTMFGYPVPQVISKASENIIFAKKIPAITEDREKRRKTYFVYSENKVLMKICNELEDEEVRYMYQLVHKETSPSVSEMLSQDEISEDEEDSGLPSRAMETSVKTRIKIQLKPGIFSGERKDIKGMKDVAFYYFVLVLMKERVQTRLHTHTLCNIFDSLKVPENAQPRRDGILNQLSRYPIASDPPGLCIILTMEEKRDGAIEDCKSVKKLFGSHFRYDIFEKINPTMQEVQDIIREVKASRNKFYDSLVVWFMSHGDKSVLKVKDGEIHRRQGLIQPFTEIEWFSKKPKLFFIQACATKRDKDTATKDTEFIPESGAKDESRSNSTDSFSVLDLNTGDKWKNKYGHRMDVCDINPFADTLVSYATKWYDKASRGRKGSLYVKTVVDQLYRFGHVEPIENVLHRVHYNTNTVLLRREREDKPQLWKQSPYFESSLQKAFIFPEPQRIID